MRSLLALGLALAFGPSLAWPVTLENRFLSLRFDPEGGRWVSWTDRLNGEELIAGQSDRAGVAPLPPVVLDRTLLARAVASRRALSLEGEWFYTPQPPPAAAAEGLVAGRWDLAKWEKTPVPSRRGAGDDRLHERVGDFWYRHEFLCPADWPGSEMALVLGAVDDFDVSYVNGVWVGNTGQETPHFWETPRCYRFPGSLLRRGQTNVVLLRVTNGAFDGGVTGPVILGLAASLLPVIPPGERLEDQTIRTTAREQRLSMAARRGDYEYRLEYVLPADEAAFSRQWTVRNASRRELLFDAAVLTTPPLAVGGRQSLTFPGTLPFGQLPVAGLREGQVLTPRSQDPLVILWDETARRGLGSWYHSEEEFAPVSVSRRGRGLEIRHSQQIVIRLAPGDSVALGQEYFWLAHGSRDAVLGGVQSVYRQIGLHAPTNGLTRLPELVLYCGHPGGMPERGFREYGGFNALRDYAPTLHSMGVDLVWLLPIWEHGDGRRWNLYSPFDHFQVSPLYGTAADLKLMSAAFATNDLRLMFDLVPHGPPDFTPLAKAHPEWAALDQAGKPRYEWTQLAFDNALPGWQDYMRRAAEWDAREFGACGARVDCAAGGPANWNPAVGRRPSRSSLAAGLGMTQAVREGYLRVQSQVVVLPEEYSGANVFNRVADLTYDAQLYFLMADLLERNAPPEEWARDFQQLLHDQQLTLPPGSLKMRWISNHDTVSWTFQKRRPLVAYGLERLRALWALCAFIPGVPMIYQGDENPALYRGTGPSSVEWLGRINALRKRSPALARGPADFQSVHASGGVFACRRGTPARPALVLISFADRPVASHLVTPSSLTGLWQDELSPDRFTAGPDWVVPMAPYQVRVLTCTSPAPR